MTWYALTDYRIGILVGLSIGIYVGMVFGRHFALRKIKRRIDEFYRTTVLDMEREKKIDEISVLINQIKEQHVADEKATDSQRT